MSSLLLDINGLLMSLSYENFIISIKVLLKFTSFLGVRGIKLPWKFLLNISTNLKSIQQ